MGVLVNVSQTTDGNQAREAVSVLNPDDQDFEAVVQAAHRRGTTKTTFHSTQLTPQSCNEKINAVSLVTW